MRAMILAAGRGERMRELTDSKPKPLLNVAGQPLIEYSIQALVKAGIDEIIINICYCGEQIKTALGDGARFGASIVYSEEATVLGTGGGILKALPLLGDQPFIALSADIITAMPLQNLPQQPTGLAHLVLVKNPPFHPAGDFGLANGKVTLVPGKTYTFANVGVYRPELFQDCQPGYFCLAQHFKTKMADDLVSGEIYSGFWENIGTPEQITSLNANAEILTL